MAPRQGVTTVAPAAFGSLPGFDPGSWYILFIACLTFPISIYRLLHPNGWTPGDWLVNYEGGFVRRGLPGESILLVGHLVHISPVNLAGVLPLILYLLFYVLVWAMYRRSSRDLWALVALVSPATLAFPILDPAGAFRKELLIMLALSGLLLWLARAPVRDAVLSVVLAVAGSAIVFSHEGLLPYLAYLLCALFLGLHDVRRVLKVALLPVLAVGGTLAEVLRHRGSVPIEHAICSSIQPVPALVCSGSIAYLANGTDVARNDVLRDLHAYHYLFYYPLVTLLAVLPLFMLARRLARDPRLRSDLIAIAVCAVAAFLASLPLFLYAMDWGRWIYIHVVCLFLLLLSVDARQRAMASAAAAVAQPAGSRLRTAPVVSPPATRPPAWAIVALVLYATCWNIPHYGNYPKKGYLNLPLHVLHLRMEGKPMRPY